MLSSKAQEQVEVLRQRQHQLETLMVADGVARFRNTAYADDFSSSPAGMRIMYEVFEGLCERIRLLQKEIEEVEIREYRHPAYTLLLKISPESLAYLTLRKGLTRPQRQVSFVSALANQLGLSIKHEAEIEEWKARAVNENGWNFAEYMMRRAKNFNLRQLSLWKGQFDDIPTLSWEYEDRLKIGAKLLQLLVEEGRGWFAIRRGTYRGKRATFFDLSDTAAEWVRGFNEKSEILSPRFLPMLVLPKSFEWDDNKRNYYGGYITIPQPLMSVSGLNKHTTKLDRPLSDTALAAINSLMRISFVVDKPVLEVAKHCYDTDNGFIDDFVSPDPVPLPQKIDDSVWNSYRDDEKKLHKRKLADIYDRRVREMSKRESVVRKFYIMNKFKDDVISHTIQCDSRTRLYYVSGSWNPQTDSLARATHRFAQKVPLGSEGFYWLKIHLANTFGYDKASFSEMVQWVEDNSQDIVKSGADPMQNKFWLEASDQLCFLQACQEYAYVVGQDNIEKTGSSIPIYQDGSNNGLQLLSLLLRDPVGAKYTNCSSDPTRYDIYAETAKEVRRLIEQDLNGEDKEMAEKWLPRIDRSLCKRACMTKPYGVSLRGIQDQLFDDKFLVRGEVRDAIYLSRKLDEALAATVVASYKLMEYFQGVADVLARNNRGLVWRTPSGCRVMQEYNKVSTKRIPTVLGKFVYYKLRQGEIARGEQKRGASPNIIHSVDAALLHIVLNRLNKEGVVGLVAIHDSFGIHAGNVPLLRDTIRQTAYDIFSNDWLNDFHQDIVSGHKHLKFPEPPEAGDFDISEVLKSDYFFS